MVIRSDSLKTDNQETPHPLTTLIGLISEAELHFNGISGGNQCVLLTFSMYFPTGCFSVFSSPFAPEEETIQHGGFNDVMLFMTKKFSEKCSQRLAEFH